MQIVLGGRGLLESPRWHGGRLYVSDWSAGEVLVLGAGGAAVVARLTSLPLCTDWLPDGRMLLVSSPDGRLLTLEPGGELRLYAELGGPGWNEVVAGRDGNVYVNGSVADPRADPAGGSAPGGIVLVTPDGSVREVAHDLAFPNGMLITSDGTTLIVADSYRHCLVGFDIDASGGLSGRRIWADLGDGVPDGICADAQGSVWYADVPHRRCVLVSEGGAALQVVDLDQGAFSCALGGPAGTTLFVATAEWRGMDDPDLVTPGSGQVVAVAL